MQIASRRNLWTDGGGGTVLVVRASPELSMTVRICAGGLAPGSESVTVKWGDGASDVYPNLDGRTHTYARPGDYTMRISDDLASFGFTAGNPGGDHYRDMLIELKRMGSKVTAIKGYGFNNCHNMRGVIELPNVTEIGGYAFGTTLGVTDFILPSMTRLYQTSFYAGPSPDRLYADNAEYIDRRFFEYYAPGDHTHPADMFIRGKTRAEIKAMQNFPFEAKPCVRFHGSDGIVLGDGTFI